MTSGSYADHEGPDYLLARVRPNSVGRAHALADLVPHSSVTGRFHRRRFDTLVDGSDRADFFPDAGRNTQDSGCSIDIPI